MVSQRQAHWSRGVDTDLILTVGDQGHCVIDHLQKVTPSAVRVGWQWNMARFVKMAQGMYQL